VNTAQHFYGFSKLSLSSNSGDEAFNRLHKQFITLFKSGVDHLTIIKWKEIYGLFETAVDRCLDAAGVIEGVVLEHS